MGQDRLKSERREVRKRGGLRHGRRKKLPGRENTGPYMQALGWEEPWHVQGSPGRLQGGTQEEKRPP